MENIGRMKKNDFLLGVLFVFVIVGIAFSVSYGATLFFNLPFWATLIGTLTLLAAAYSCLAVRAGGQR